MVSGLDFPSVRRYLNDVFALLFSYLGEDKVVSLYVFGSILNDDYCDISDCDLLIVLNDEVSLKQIKRIRGSLECLEIKHGLRSKDYSLLGRILRSIEKSTGMFESHFVCRKNDVLKGSFTRVFSTSRFMSKLLAPSAIVFGSVLSTARKIYGQDILREVAKPKHTTLMLLKSLAMNLLLSLSAIVLYPFSPKANKYEIEAAKWSMLASYYHLNESNPGIVEITNFFTNLGLSEYYFKRLLKLRKHYKNDVKFGLATPLQVLKIHTKTLSHSKK
ncbi:MAG: nucleotidyltransferase domain-containing protein [Candidatus Jordarchaeaceae archaeon]